MLFLLYSFLSIYLASLIIFTNFGLLKKILLRFISFLTYEIKFIITVLFCGILTVRGWLRAEGLVVDYGGYRFQGIDSGGPEEIVKPATKYGGILFLTTFIGLRFFCGAILVVVFFDWRHI